MLEEYTFVKDISRIQKGKEKVSEHLENVNLAKVADLVTEQVDIVGGAAMYDRVDDNLKRGVIELSLIREMCDLYKWRQDWIFCSEI